MEEEMYPTQLSLDMFFEQTKDKSDNEIKAMFLKCSKEELVDNLLVVFNELKQKNQFSNTVSDLIAQYKQNNTEMKQIIEKILLKS